MLFFKEKKDNSRPGRKNALQNPKILEVNLIKGEVKISFDWKKNISVLFLVLVIAGAFVAEIYYGLDWWQQQETVKADSLTVEINKTKSEISKIQRSADEALSYKDKAVEVSRLFGNHIYWTNFFSWIEKNTLSTVKFGGFSGDAGGKYTLDARALSYAEVSWQTKAFLNEPIVGGVEVLKVESAVSKDKTKAAEKGVNFSLNLEVKPEIFKK